MKAKFKIDQLAAVDCIEKELVHPKQGNTGIFVTIAGPQHPEWVAAAKKFTETPEDTDRAFELFASAVLAWDEEAMGPYSHEAVLTLFRNPKQDWFAKNIIEVTQDHSLFFL